MAEWFLPASLSVWYYRLKLLGFRLVSFFYLDI